VAIGPDGSLGSCRRLEAAGCRLEAPLRAALRAHRLATGSRWRCTPAVAGKPSTRRRSLCCYGPCKGGRQLEGEDRDRDRPRRDEKIEKTLGPSL
jgi:hypothetical protein